MVFLGTVFSGSSASAKQLVLVFTEIKDTGISKNKEMF